MTISVAKDIGSEIKHHPSVPAQAIALGTTVAGAGIKAAPYASAVVLGTVSGAGATGTLSAEDSADSTTGLDGTWAPYKPDGVTAFSTPLALANSGTKKNLGLGNCRGWIRLKVVTGATGGVYSASLGLSGGVNLPEADQ